MDDTTQKNDKPGYDDTEGYALELIERWKERSKLSYWDRIDKAPRERLDHWPWTRALIEWP